MCLVCVFGLYHYVSIVMFCVCLIYVFVCDGVLCLFVFSSCFSHCVFVFVVVV